ncbi:MAG: hypothetical protein WKF57_08895 [Nakamurella sp.]
MTSIRRCRSNAVVRVGARVLAVIVMASGVAAAGASCGPHTEPGQIVTSTSTSA